MEEDFHGVHLVFAATVGGGDPAVREHEGTTDAVAWIALADCRVRGRPGGRGGDRRARRWGRSIDLAHGH